jgi:hypothetical protein
VSLSREIALLNLKKIIRSFEILDLKKKPISKIAILALNDITNRVNFRSYLNWQLQD